MVKIIVKDIVDNCSDNASGLKILTLVEDALKAGDEVMVFLKVFPMSALLLLIQLLLIYWRTLPLTLLKQNSLSLNQLFKLTS